MSKKKCEGDSGSRDSGDEPYEVVPAKKPDICASPAQDGLAALDAEIMNGVFSGKYDRQWRKQEKRTSRDERRK